MTICSNPLLKQGHAEQGAQDHVQAASEKLEGGRRHNLSGQLSGWEGQCEKKVSEMSKENDYLTAKMFG